MRISLQQNFDECLRLIDSNVTFALNFMQNVIGFQECAVSVMQSAA